MRKNPCITFSVIDEKLPDREFNTLLLNLPLTMREKLLRFRNWQDAQASLTGKLLLQNLLSKLAPDLTLHDITYNNYGRPFFKDRDIDFNISHSGKYVVCAFGAYLRLGIDIEVVKPIDPQEFTQYFSEDEMRAIVCSRNSLSEFYDIWTMKESLIKAIGKGLSFPLSDVYIKNQKSILEEQTWHLMKIEISPDYRCHVSTNYKVTGPIDVEEVRILPYR